MKTFTSFITPDFTVKVLIFGFWTLGVVYTICTAR